ncbi:hypothetical protein FHT93_003958 [Rhizobium sp. BK379]|jgi:hypothetical protein|nr:hypothetical protein [Rhizobium sp. BK379]
MAALMSTPVKVARGPDQIMCYNEPEGITLNDPFAVLAPSHLRIVRGRAPALGTGSTEPLANNVIRLAGALPPDRSAP